MSDTSFPVANNLTPIKTDGGNYDPRALTHVFNFAAGGVTSPSTFELFKQSEDDRLQFVQAVYIDNSLNASTFTLTLLGTQQNITAQPFTQGVYPAFAMTPLAVTATTAGNVAVSCLFLNMPVPYVVWGPSTPAGGSTSPIVNGALTDRSGTLTLGASSQVIMPANATRKAFNIYNPSTAALQAIAVAESIFIKFGAAATIDGKSYEILPGGSFDSATFGNFVSNQTINLIATTIGHTFAASEG